MITTILNGTQHRLPETDETDWGLDATAFLQDVAEVLDGTFQEVTAGGAVTNIDFDNGKNVDLTLNATTTLVFANPRVGRPAVFQVFQGGSYAIAWPANIKWRGGRPPVITLTAGKVDVICLLYNATRDIYTGEFAQDFA